MRKILVGSADVRTFVELRDSNGALLTGETAAAATIYYIRNGETPVPVGAVAGTVGGAHTDGGFIEVDSANQPGLYQVDWPDAAFVTGAPSVVVSINTTNSEGYNEEMEIDDGALSAVALAAIQDEVDAALATYDAPTRTEATADKDEILTEVGLVKAKTDDVNFTKAGEVDINLKSINDVTIVGDGTEGNEFTIAP